MRSARIREQVQVECGRVRKDITRKKAACVKKKFEPAMQPFPDAVRSI